MSNDADLEYGPTPEGSTYEHTDIEPTIAGRFAIWLFIAMGISAGIVYGTFWLFEGQEKASSEAAQMFPLAAGQEREPAGPQLQRQPFKDIFELRGGEAKKLSGYAWVDQNAGVVRIPVDEALRIMAQRGAIKSAAQDPNGLNQVVQDSSAGRTTARRY